MKIRKPVCSIFRCAHCSAPRLSEPLAHFCQKCGSPVPPVPFQCFSVPEGTQMAPCLECRHLVPMNTPTCIICEAPIAPQLQPQNNICIKGKVICQVCGTGNPLHHKHCATCESKLPEVQMPMFGGDSCPALQGQPGKTAPCSKCGGVNQSDARFCAWCGAKARAPAACGDKPGAPLNYIYITYIFLLLHPLQAKLLQAQVAWQTCPVSLPKSRAKLTEREDKGTQTIGLFYPSSKLLEKKELELISQKEKMEKMSDHKPLLTAISPGKGYWRKQLDHVCAHLRSYAQNNLEFRTLIGEPQMGKSGISNNETQIHQIHVTVCILHFDSMQNLAHLLVFSLCEAFLAIVSPQPESRQLLDELGQTGKGRITFIEQLLNDGADPNSLSQEERPALTVAVLNKHTGAISPLVQKGADIDQQSGPHNNTALHEAVLLGLEGEESIRALLGCNASVQKKNAAGHSALDLAVAAGDNKVISLFQVSVDRKH
uniref:Double zinc ribbon and ankyrin repeat domains 1 n=1 Tax=Serinus canaria TaxID=9135 RepID=A0A8C9NG86_SERCA